LGAPPPKMDNVERAFGGVTDLVAAAAGLVVGLGAPPKLNRGFAADFEEGLEVDTGAGLGAAVDEPPPKKENGCGLGAGAGAG